MDESPANYATNDLNVIRKTYTRKTRVVIEAKKREQTNLPVGLKIVT